MKDKMKILVAIDGSEFGLAAVEEVARQPWPKGTMVRILSAVEIPMPMTIYAMPVPGGDFAAWEKAFEDQAIANTTQALARFSELAGPDIEVTTKVSKGDPKEVLPDEAANWGADLLVVGTHGYNVFERFWLGSVSRTAAAHAPCSVRIARKHPAPTTPALKILLAVDGSECGDKAVEEVAVRPWPAGSEVRLLSAIHLPMTPTPETWALPDSYYANLERVGREHADEALNRALARLNESNAEREIPLTITQTAVVGHAEELLISTAKEWGANLIVLGSHGYKGFRRFLLGSVSQAVAAHAPCSVEIVRPPQIA